MTCYRELLAKDHDQDTGSIVGCGLDRTEQEFMYSEVSQVIAFFKDQKEHPYFNSLPIGHKRQLIAEYAISLSVKTKTSADILANLTSCHRSSDFEYKSSAGNLPIN